MYHIINVYYIYLFVIIYVINNTIFVKIMYIVYSILTMLTNDAILNILLISQNRKIYEFTIIRVG